MAVSAQDVDIDGIYYRIDDGQAIVISHPDEYSGDIVIPSTVNYGGDFPVTGISDGAFERCSDLQSVTIPSSVTSIGNGAFEGCSSLTSITIPSSVTFIGNNAFYYCTSLRSITIPSSVTSIGGGIISGCSSLTSIVVEEGNAQYDSRDNCNAIIDKANNMLIAGCQNTVIPSSVTSIGGGAFEGCSSLTSITIPSSVTSIGWGITSGCSSLTSIVVEKRNTHYDSRDNCNAIIDKTFNMLVAGCKTTVIPSGVTFIGESAFQGIPLTSIVIPGSVTELWDLAFAECSALTDVYCLAENAPSATSREFLRSSYETATLYVPPTSVEKYKAAAPWKDFGNIVSLPMCAKPTIATVNGKLTFSCETEGVEFVVSVSPSGKTTYKGSSLLLANLTTTYRVSVYARKEDFVDSEAATIDVDYLPDLDDVNGDGQISISDVVGIVDIILKGN